MVPGWSPRGLRVAPRAGFEPATNRLTAGCSTTELPGNIASEEKEPPINKPVSACLARNASTQGSIRNGELLPDMTMPAAGVRGRHFFPKLSLVRAWRPCWLVAAVWRDPAGPPP